MIGRLGSGLREVWEHAMITCRELTEFLDDYVAGALGVERRAVFEGHLAVCPDCRNFLASYRRTIGLVRGTGEAVSAEVPEGLVRAVLAARDEGKGRD